MTFLRSCVRVLVLPPFQFFSLETAHFLAPGAVVERCDTGDFHRVPQQRPPVARTAVASAGCLQARLRSRHRMRRKRAPPDRATERRGLLQPRLCREMETGAGKRVRARRTEIDDHEGAGKCAP